MGNGKRVKIRYNKITIVGTELGIRIKEWQKKTHGQNTIEIITQAEER